MKKYNANSDCFAYQKEEEIEKCKILNNIYCRYEKCPFYKTHEQFKKGAKDSGCYEKHSRI